VDLPALKFLKTAQFEDLANGFQALSAGAGQGKDDIENNISAKMRLAKLSGLGADVRSPIPQGLGMGARRPQVAR
jgi:hypothetical protein